MSNNVIHPSRQRHSSAWCPAWWPRWRWAAPALSSAAPTIPDRPLRPCGCRPLRSPESCWRPKGSRLCTEDLEPLCLGDSWVTYFFRCRRWTLMGTGSPVVQGHPLLGGLLPPVCTPAQAGPAFSQTPVCAFLLVLHFRLPGRLCRCCGCQSLWWWGCSCDVVFAYERVGFFFMILHCTVLYSVLLMWVWICLDSK